jgi:hypothetical protein
MTDANYTHITVLLDESGSMGHLAEDTRGGFNNFLTEQQAVEGKATMTVCKFSSGYTILSSMRDIKSVEPLTVRTYSPGGGTALLDAMGRCITELGSALAKMPEEKRPGKVLFLVITDGEENASKEWTKAKIAEMVKHQEEAYKWNFLYLGANVDAFGESADLGIRASNAIGYTASAKGIGAAYNVMSRGLSAVRGIADQNAQYDVFCSAHVDDLQNVDMTKSVTVNSSTTDSSKS